MTHRSDRAAHTFEQIFGREPEIVADAPGRVNLIGEHTDYNGGYVLPIAIPQRTRVELRAREDHLVRAASADVPSPARITYVLGEEARTGGWIDYVQGVTRALREAGFAVTGFDVRFASTVPLAAGLSSSAALEIGLLRALRQAFALTVDDVALARIAQAAETGLVGAPVGIMDQMASSLADTTHALFLDTRTGVYERITLPEAMELVVIDSGISHRNAPPIADDGHRDRPPSGRNYTTRRAECEAAAALLGVTELRDVHEARLADLDGLPPLLARRARHVVTENARVLAAVDALREAQLTALGALFDASHVSMRDDFDVSEPEIDRLVELTRAQEGTYGARLTGGGFGGAIVAAVQRGRGAEIAEQARVTYEERTSRKARVVVPPPPHPPARAGVGHEGASS